MRWSPLTVLAAVEPHLPARLVGRDQLHTCRRIAAKLSSCIGSYYLECRLDDDPQVDFLVLTDDRLGAITHFEESLNAPPPSIPRQRTLELLRGWAGGNPLLSGAPLVWFEYDVDRRFHAHAPEASPSVCLERMYFVRFENHPVIDIEAADARAGAVLEYLIDDARRAWVKQTLQRVVAALPAGGSLIYVSEMLTRSPNATKLYVAVPKSSVLDFLSRVCWPGDLADVREILSDYYGPITETVFLDLSIVDDVIARLGFAFSQFHRREMESFDPCWSWLPMPGIHAEKQNALARWPGEDDVRLGISRMRLRRWLDVKLVLSETRDISFKAYLGFMPALRSLEA